MTSEVKRYNAQGLLTKATSLDAKFVSAADYDAQDEELIAERQLSGSLKDMLERAEEETVALRAENERLKKQVELYQEFYNLDDLQRIRELKTQLPAEMQHCTIVFEECPQGHGSLRGTNWIKHDCPWCRIRNLETALTVAIEEHNAVFGRNTHPEHWTNTSTSLLTST